MEERLQAQRIRWIKWAIFGLAIVAITLLEAYHYYRKGTFGELLAIWLGGIIISVIIIEIAFRAIGNIQSQIARQSEGLQLRLHQQEMLIRLNAKLGITREESQICQTAFHELKSALGNEAVSVYIELETGGNRMRYGDATTPSSNISQRSSTRVRAPLRSGGQTFGNLNVESRFGNAFSAEEVAVIYTAANQTTIALENARQFAQIQSQQSNVEQHQSELLSRERNLTLLNSITQDALRATDFHATLQTLTEHLGKIFEADQCILALWDDSLSQVVPYAASGLLRHTIRTIRYAPTEIMVIPSVLSSGRAKVIDNTQDSPDIAPRLAAVLHCRSLLALPMIAADQKLGVALISFEIQHTFNQSEISFGEQAASQIALAISKSRALDTSQRRAQELDALQRATAALLTTLDLEALLGQILDAAMSANLSADKGALHLIVPETGQLQIRATQGYSDPRIRSFQPTSNFSYAAKAVRDRNPLIINDLQAEAIGTSEGDFPEGGEVASMIIAPLILEEKALGALALGSFRRHAFTDANLRLLVSFAATATAAINNAQLHGEVQKQAVTDTLTGLYNRRGLFDLARREVMRAQRFHRTLSTLLIDIDHFKEINDTYGHWMGDQILAGVSRQCLAELRQVDLIGRYGGDEFLAFLPETELPSAVMVAERLRRKVAELTFSTEETVVKVSLSAGVACLAEDENLEALIQRTDQALYKAKLGGKNRVETV